MSPDDESTAELRIEQVRRAQSERAAAERTPDDDQAAEHDRRAERAAYLAAKLSDRERSEQE